jgi:hypothetical protein
LAGVWRDAVNIESRMIPKALSSETRTAPPQGTAGRS